MTRRGLGLALLVLAAVATPLAAAPNAATIGRQLERRMPGTELVLEERLTIGRFKLGVAKAAVRFAADDPETRQILRGVRRVEIADYTVSALPALDEIDAFDLIESSDWTRLLFSHEETELTWVYLRQSKERITGLMVVSLDDVSLSVVSLEGKIGEMLERMANEEPEGIRGLF